MEDLRKIEFARTSLGDLDIQVVDACDRKTGFSVSGQVGIADDIAGADNDNRLWLCWTRPSLLK